MDPKTSVDAETLATEVLREGLYFGESDVQQKRERILRFAKLAGTDPALVKRLPDFELEFVYGIAGGAFRAGLAIGQRLRPNALDPKGVA